DNATNLKTNAYYSHYAFELYSNFTFFLEDPINGDQIRQVEDRQIFGLNSALTHETKLGNIPLKLTSGIGFRHDMVDDIELSRTLNRSTTLENVQLGDLNQTNIDAFITAELDRKSTLLNSSHVKISYAVFCLNKKIN